MTKMKKFKWKKGGPLSKKEFVELRKKGVIRKGARWDSWKKAMSEL